MSELQFLKRLKTYSVTKKDLLFLHKYTHHAIPCKINHIKYTFVVTLEVEGVLFFLMVSYLHKKLQTK